MLKIHVRVTFEWWQSYQADPEDNATSFIAINILSPCAAYVWFNQSYEPQSHLHTVETEIDTPWVNILSPISHHILQLTGQALVKDAHNRIPSITGIKMGILFSSTFYSDLLKPSITWTSMSLSLWTCWWSYSISLLASSQAAPSPTTRGVGTVPLRNPRSFWE